MKPLYHDYNNTVFPIAAPGRADYLPQFPDWIDQVVVSTTSTSWTPPTGARFVILSGVPGVRLAVKPNGPATMPVGAITDGSGSFPDPVGFELVGVTTLGIVADGPGVLSLICYG